MQHFTNIRYVSVLDICGYFGLCLWAWSDKGEGGNLQLRWDNSYGAFSPAFLQ